MLDDILRTLKSPASEHLPARIKAASRLASDKSLVYPNKLDFVLNWTLLLLAKFQNPFASNADPDSSESLLSSYVDAWNLLNQILRLLATRTHDHSQKKQRPSIVPCFERLFSWTAWAARHNKTNEMDQRTVLGKLRPVVDLSMEVLKDSQRQAPDLLLAPYESFANLVESILSTIISLSPSVDLLESWADVHREWISIYLLSQKSCSNQRKVYQQVVSKLFDPLLQARAILSLPSSSNPVLADLHRIVGDIVGHALFSQEHLMDYANILHARDSATQPATSSETVGRDAVGYQKTLFDKMQKLVKGPLSDPILLGLPLILESYLEALDSAAETRKSSTEFNFYLHIFKLLNFDQFQSPLRVKVMTSLILILSRYGVYRATLDSQFMRAHFEHITTTSQKLMPAADTSLYELWKALVDLDYTLLSPHMPTIWRNAIYINSAGNKAVEVFSVTLLSANANGRSLEPFLECQLDALKNYSPPPNTDISTCPLLSTTYISAWEHTFKALTPMIQVNLLRIFRYIIEQSSALEPQEPPKKKRKTKSPNSDREILHLDPLLVLFAFAIQSASLSVATEAAFKDLVSEISTSLLDHVFDPSSSSSSSSSQTKEIRWSHLILIQALETISPDYLSLNFTPQTLSTLESIKSKSPELIYVVARLNLEYASRSSSSTSTPDLLVSKIIDCIDTSKTTEWNGEVYNVSAENLGLAMWSLSLEYSSVIMQAENKDILNRWINLLVQFSYSAYSKTPAGLLTKSFLTLGTIQDEPQFRDVSSFVFKSLVSTILPTAIISRRGGPEIESLIALIISPTRVNPLLSPKLKHRATELLSFLVSLSIHQIPVRDLDWLIWISVLVEDWVLDVVDIEDVYLDFRRATVSWIQAREDKLVTLYDPSILLVYLSSSAAHSIALSPSASETIKETSFEIIRLTLEKVDHAITSSSSSTTIFPFPKGSNLDPKSYATQLLKSLIALTKTSTQTNKSKFYIEASTLLVSTLSTWSPSSLHLVLTLEDLDDLIQLTSRIDSRLEMKLGIAVCAASLALKKPHPKTHFLFTSLIQKTLAMDFDPELSSLLGRVLKTYIHAPHASKPFLDACLSILTTRPPNPAILESNKTVEGPKDAKQFEFSGVDLGDVVELVAKRFIKTMNKPTHKNVSNLIVLVQDFGLSLMNESPFKSDQFQPLVSKLCKLFALNLNLEHGQVICEFMVSATAGRVELSMTNVLSILRLMSLVYVHDFKVETNSQHQTNTQIESIFNSICRILSNIIRNFNHHLPSHYHTLLAAFRPLLHFHRKQEVSFKESSSSSEQFTRHLLSKLFGGCRLSTDAADNLARLFSTIASKSHTTRTHKPKHDLNTSQWTLKAVSKHFSPLLIEYSFIQSSPKNLNNLSHLQPGIYALLDSTTDFEREFVLRQLDYSPAAKSVFKLLVQEWERTHKYTGGQV